MNLALDLNSNQCWKCGVTEDDTFELCPYCGMCPGCESKEGFCDE